LSAYFLPNQSTCGHWNLILLSVGDALVDGRWESHDEPCHFGLPKFGYKLRQQLHSGGSYITIPRGSWSGKSALEPLDPKTGPCPG
jgi:hypothetical protein